MEWNGTGVGWGGMDWMGGRVGRRFCLVFFSGGFFLSIFSSLSVCVCMYDVCVCALHVLYVYVCVFDLIDLIWFDLVWLDLIRFGLV